MNRAKRLLPQGFTASAVVGLALLTGCTNVERSRNWSNEEVQGEVLAQQVCSTCHGLAGQSANSLFPKLAGQKKEYIESQLEAIRSRDRNSEHTRQFMWGPARYLTNKQIEELASYFSSKPAMTADTHPAAANELGATPITRVVRPPASQRVPPAMATRPRGTRSFPVWPGNIAITSSRVPASRWRGMWRLSRTRR